jgi:hypothetical protein
MIELLLCGDVAMNLIGLILIAALSGFIVAVSLRLRPKESTLGFQLEADTLHEHEPHHQATPHRSFVSRAA